ncbi:MAG: Gldg family protein [Deltaproteobacteria bacterium]|nr:Gldg family protein [Deltaproteobacteria bacterium]
MGIDNRSGDYFRFVIYLAIIVLVNVAGITLFFRIDLTSNKIYSLSEASKTVVSTLSEPLTINVFFTRNLPAPHNNTERYLHDLMEEYSMHGNRYFNYRFYDVSSDEGDISQKKRENQELARSYGIHPLQIQIVENDEVKFQRAYMGLVLIHGDLIERIPAITTTDKLEYRLTAAIQRLNNKISALLRLDGKIKIKLYLSSSLQSVAPYMGLKDLSDIPPRIEDIVKSLNEKSYGKLEFIYLDPSETPGLDDELRSYKIMSLKWPEIPEKKIASGKGSIGLVMEYGDGVVDIPLLKVMRLPIVGTHYQLAELDELEDVINENIESLIDINEDLGYLADHGTPSLWGSQGGIPGMPSQESLSNFNALASQTYSVKGIRLSNEDIPESLNCLIIAGPTEPFTDYEIYQIDQFLMRGKNLALFLDAFSEEGAQGMPMTRGSAYQPLNTGLEKLVRHYGISVRNSYVMDENCYMQRIPQNYGGGEKPLYFVPIIMNRFINKDLPFIENIKGLIVSKVSPLETHQKTIEDNNLKVITLFSSSERSWEMKDWIDLNPMTMMPPPGDTEFKSMPLAYILEGEFPSFFEGKPIPEREIKKEEEKEDQDNEKESSSQKATIDLSKVKSEGGFLSKGMPGRIFIIASSELLKDHLIDSEGASTNSSFVLNLIDYLNNREAMAVMRSKVNTYNPLVNVAGGTRAFIKYFNIVGLPVIVVLFGIFIWFRRHKRKKVIQAIFGQ